ncbi:hypothetical protein Tco_0206156 [Tanacetum coccineum]
MEVSGLNEANTIGKNLVVYVNKEGQSTMKAVMLGNGNESAPGVGNKVDNGADVANTWSKYGLVKSMMTSGNGLFFFKFSSKEDMDAMLENGPWFIVFSEDGSVIATKFGTPLMLDSYISAMCIESWGSSSFARVMIELKADVELKDTTVVFGHVLNDCPKRIVSNVLKNLKNPRHAARGVQINNLERQMLDGKCVLVDDDGKPLNKVDSPTKSDSHNEGEEVFNDCWFYGINELKQEW